MSKVVNWAAIEPDYRAGIKSIRQIARENGVSDPAVLKHAKAMGWARDLGNRIRAQTKAKLGMDAVSKPVSTKTEASIVDANSNQQVIIVRRERADIRGLMEIIPRQRDELLAGSLSQDDLAQLVATIAKIKAGNDPAKFQEEIKSAWDLLARFPGLQARAQVLKSLTDSLKTLIALEREAFGINDEVDTEDVFIAALKRIHGITE